MKKIKEIFVLVVFGAGILAIGYLILAGLSFAAMLDGGGSAVILDSMKNPYVATSVLILALSLILTWDRAKDIMV